jgi:hypothetical protein
MTQKNVNLTPKLKLLKQKAKELKEFQVTDLTLKNKKTPKKLNRIALYSSFAILSVALGFLTAYAIWSVNQNNSGASANLQQSDPNANQNIGGGGLFPNRSSSPSSKATLTENNENVNISTAPEIEVIEKDNEIVSLVDAPISSSSASLSQGYVRSVSSVTFSQVNNSTTNNSTVVRSGGENLLFSLIVLPLVLASLIYILTTKTFKKSLKINK